MDVTGELIAAVGKDGVLVVGLIYLWKRIESVTDSYLQSLKENAKIIADNTIATISYTRALDALTASINAIRKDQ